MPEPPPAAPVEWLSGPVIAGEPCGQLSERGLNRPTAPAASRLDVGLVDRPFSLLGSPVRLR